MSLLSRTQNLGRRLAAAGAGGALAAALAAAPSIAGAANASLSLNVTPLQTTVSVGRAKLQTYAAYRVDIANTAGNTTNNISFFGTASVPAAGFTLDSGATAPSVTYLETKVPGATAPSNICNGSGANFTCPIGQLKAGESRSFIISFNAPSVSPGVNYNSAAALRIDWTFDYSNGGSSVTPSSDYAACDGRPLTADRCVGDESASLITAADGDFPKSVKSYIPTTGGTFFTNKGQTVSNDANSGVACPSRQPCTITVASALGKVETAPGVFDYTASMAALLRVGASEPVQTVEIDSGVVPGAGGLTTDTETTNETFIRVPVANVPFSVPALVELRRDASTILNKTAQAVRNAPIFYQSTEVYEPYQIPTPVLVKNCADLPNQQPNAADPVCVFSRTAYRGGTKPPTPDDAGDWRFVLKVLQNGKASW